MRSHMPSRHSQWGLHLQVVDANVHQSRRKHVPPQQATLQRSCTSASVHVKPPNLVARPVKRALEVSISLQGPQTWRLYPLVICMMDILYVHPVYWRLSRPPMEPLRCRTDTKNCLCSRLKNLPPDFLVVWEEKHLQRLSTPPNCC